MKIGDRITGQFTQNGQPTLRVFGTVTGTYVAELHGFKIPMATVACTDGRTRHVWQAKCRELPTETRYVRLVSTPPGGGGWMVDEIFRGTLGEFMEAFGLGDASRAEREHGTAMGLGPAGEPVTLTWGPAESE